MLPRFPIWDDVRTFDGRPWRGIVDCVCGGFPCTDIAPCGKRAGIDGKESGLWREMARIICEIRPQYVFVENSANLVVSGLDRVLGDLSKMGYNAIWGVMGGERLGRTNRKRCWIVGKPHSDDLARPNFYKGTVPQVDLRSATEQVHDAISTVNRRIPRGIVCGMDYGLPHWVDRFRAAGMAQIPLVAASAFYNLSRALEALENECNGQVPLVGRLLGEF